MTLAQLLLIQLYPGLQMDPSQPEPVSYDGVVKTVGYGDVMALYHQ